MLREKEPTRPETHARPGSPEDVMNGNVNVK